MPAVAAAVSVPAVSAAASVPAVTAAAPVSAVSAAAPVFAVSTVPVSSSPVSAAAGTGSVASFPAVSAEGYAASASAFVSVSGLDEDWPQAAEARTRHKTMNHTAVLFQYFILQSPFLNRLFIFPLPQHVYTLRTEARGKDRVIII